MKIIDLLTRIDAQPGKHITKHEDAYALVRLGLATESLPGTVTNSGDGRDLLHGASERRMSA